MDDHVLMITHGMDDHPLMAPPSGFWRLLRAKSSADSPRAKCASSRSSAAGSLASTSTPMPHPLPNTRRSISGFVRVVNLGVGAMPTAPGQIDRCPEAHRGSGECGGSRDGAGSGIIVALHLSGWTLLNLSSVLCVKHFPPLLFEPVQCSSIHVVNVMALVLP